MTTFRDDELDELLQPTVAPPPRRGPLPWRVSSQFWVAFFGGIPAVTAIAWLNARRLGSTIRKQQLIILSGILAAAAYIAFVVYLVPAQQSSKRLAGRIIAVLLFLLLARIQRDDELRHQVFGKSRYASLWLAGVLACVISIAVVIAIELALR
jgi:hypothetical protein